MPFGTKRFSGEGGGPAAPDDAPATRHEVLVLAFTPDGVSRVARPLRARGCSVRTCADTGSLLDLLSEGQIDLIVVESDEHDENAIECLKRVNRRHQVVPCVLVTSYEPGTLALAINEARVTRVVSAQQDTNAIVDEIFGAIDRQMGDPKEIQRWRSRCNMLEAKIDRLVREGIQREGAAHLLHDLLVEIGQSSGVKEIAGRCLARLVTMLRLDMAFIVLDTHGPGSDPSFFSFGCPRLVLDRLRELPWNEVARAFGTGESPRPILETLPEPVAATLARSLQIEGVTSLVLIELRTRNTPLGFVGLCETRARSAGRTQWDQLRPVVRQIAIALDSSRLADSADTSEALASAVLQQLPSTVLVCDASGRIQRCYDTKQRLFSGRTTAGKGWSDLLPDPEAKQILTHISSVMRGGDAIQLRALRWKLAGTERLLNLAIVALPSKQIMIILEDVTQRESIVGDLRRARALTSSLFANAPAGVLFIRKNGEIIDINAKACAILHGTRTNLLGANLGDRYPELWRTINLQVDGGHGEIVFSLADGDHASVSFSTIRLGRSRSTGILLQIHDTAELQSLREQLRRKDNLALMGQMVSFIAHEIKNPLFGISSAAQVLARATGDEANQRLSDAMLSEVSRLSTLLEDLLIFGSKRAFDPIETDPLPICEEMAAIYSERFSQRGVVLRLSLDPATPATLFDPARLRQIVVNLLDNAVDATPREGTVTLAARGDTDACIISVTNSGDPIPEATQERVFDLFFSTKPRGSGLGLAICQKILEDHGGRIEVESSQEEGTTFSICIPVARGGEDARS